jgi:hypothetical protein
MQGECHALPLSLELYDQQQHNVQTAQQLGAWLTVGLSYQATPLAELYSTRDFRS